jgi:hypothetical protein
MHEVAVAAVGFCVADFPVAAASLPLARTRMSADADAENRRSR